MGTKNNPGKFDCYEKADPDEPMFVLLGRDPLASVLVQLWADWNVSLRQSYDKTQEAKACARAMAEWAEKLGKNVPWRSDLIADLRANVYPQQIAPETKVGGGRG